MNDKKDNNLPTSTEFSETRHVVIYGYTRAELANIMRHFEAQLPEFVKITIDNNNLVTRVTLTAAVPLRNSLR